MGQGPGVQAAGGAEQVELGVSQVEVAAAPLFSQLRTARAVVRVLAVAQPAAVVEQGEQLHHPLVGAGGRGQAQAVGPDPGQVTETVDAVPVDVELVADGLDEFR